MSVLQWSAACVALLAVFNVAAVAQIRRSEIKPAPQAPVAFSKPVGSGDEPSSDFKPPPADPLEAVGNRVVPVATIPKRLLELYAKEYFEAGWYQEALDAYTLWRSVHWCGNGQFSDRGERWHRIALCNIHLNDHAVAAQACFDALQKCDWYDNGTCELLFLLYREAGQLNDLTQWLDAIEDVEIRKQPKAWLLPPAERTKLVKHLRTGRVREIMVVPQIDAPKWPVSLPRPKAGTLPKVPLK